jgi:hypothetical protein
MQCARCDELYRSDRYFGRSCSPPPRLAIAMRCSCGETLCPEHWNDHTIFRDHNREPLAPAPTMRLKGEISKCLRWRKREGREHHT